MMGNAADSDGDEDGYSDRNQSDTPGVPTLAGRR
jgi:hypothetical protein